MGKKIRLIRTMVLEYEPIVEAYPEGSTIEQMAQIDANTDTPDLLFGSCALEEDNIKYEIID